MMGEQPKGFVVEKKMGYTRFLETLGFFASTSPEHVRSDVVMCQV